MKKDFYKTIINCKGKEGGAEYKLYRANQMKRQLVLHEKETVRWS